MNFLKGLTGGDGGKEGGGTGGGWLESLKEKSKELAEVYKRDIGMASVSEFSLHLRQHFQHLRDNIYFALSASACRLRCPLPSSCVFYSSRVQLNIQTPFRKCSLLVFVCLSMSLLLELSCLKDSLFTSLQQCELMSLFCSLVSGVFVCSEKRHGSSCGRRLG